MRTRWNQVKDMR